MVAGILFAGYAAMAIPSNIVISYTGARTWLPIITFLWGCVAACNAAATNAATFCALRFLLGAAEAGNFPGAMLFRKASGSAPAKTARPVAYLQPLCCCTCRLLVPLYALLEWLFTQFCIRCHPQLCCSVPGTGWSARIGTLITGD